MNRVIIALSLLLLLGLSTIASAEPTVNGASSKLLTSQNSALILIDHQPQMAFATHSIDTLSLINNVTGLAKAAKIFKVPTILTTVASKTFSGPLFPAVQAVFPDQKPIDRTTMNSWEDKNFLDAVKKTGRKKLVIAALWTEVCLMGPTLGAIDDGYEVYIVTDASGGVSTEAHEMAIRRMIQAGAMPVTWLQVLLEYQRDWARQDTYAAVTNLAKEHAGAYGLGIDYAKTMFGGSEGHK
ncbi:MAG: hydrolase [Nitrospira sp.]|nr:hydrolase [Nitrospira sp.]MDH4304895.1 hydrolase [Nitrospira sp.]MDH5194012.1 hydrolase [Nitrospira sp.]